MDPAPRSEPLEQSIAMFDPNPAFSLTEPDAYAAWRERKLSTLPAGLADLIVEVRDPRQLSDAEQAALLARVRRGNFAIYVGGTGDDPDKTIVQRLGAQFGLRQLDHNPGADEDAVTSIQVLADAPHSGYIPYSERPIAWHTDGYYNPPERRVRGLILHCVRPAEVGGENALMDPELLYLRLRDQDPAHIAALMRSDVMTIPAIAGEGMPERGAVAGPVFISTAEGTLEMRYTDRRRNVQWRDDPQTEVAVAALRALLADPQTQRFQARLEAGWGLLCNNVLHTRTAFTDGAATRLLYRARYYERIAGS